MSQEVLCITVVETISQLAKAESVLTIRIIVVHLKFKSVKWLSRGWMSEVRFPSGLMFLFTTASRQALEIAQPSGFSFHTGKEAGS
jgi:hypothetical protein